MSERPLSTRDIAEGRRPDPRGVDPRDDRRDDQPPGARRTGAATAEAASHTPLFDEADAQGLRTRWEAIQTGFVDEPRAAVEQADALVAQVMKRLAEVFTGERTALEQQWSRGENVSTEDLRVALKRYRSFFERLLSA